MKTALFMTAGLLAIGGAGVAAAQTAEPAHAAPAASSPAPTDAHAGHDMGQSPAPRAIRTPGTT